MKRLKELRIQWSILLFLPLFVGSAFGQDLLDRIVAIVDDEVVLDSEITQMAWMMAAQMGVDPARDQDKFLEYRKLAVKNIVTKEKIWIRSKVELAITINNIKYSPNALLGSMVLMI